MKKDKVGLAQLTLLFQFLKKSRTCLRALSVFLCALVTSAKLSDFRDRSSPEEQQADLSWSVKHALFDQTTQQVNTKTDFTVFPMDVGFNTNYTQGDTQYRVL